MEAFDGKDFSLFFENGAKGLRMVWVAPTTCVLGTPDEEWIPGRCSHEDEVEFTITKGYWIGQYPISVKQYNMLAEEKDSSENEDGSKLCEWREIIKWCFQLNKKYEVQLPKGYHFSLPSEAH